MASETQNETVSTEKAQTERAVALENYAFYGSRKYFIILSIALPILIYLFYNQVLRRSDAIGYEKTWPFVNYIIFCALVYLFSFIRLTIWLFKVIVRNDTTIINAYSKQSRINIVVFKGNMQKLVYVVIVILGANIAEFYGFYLTGKAGPRGMAVLIADACLLIQFLYYLYRAAAWYLFQRRT